MRTQTLAMLLISLFLLPSGARASEPYASHTGTDTGHHHLMAWVPVEAAATAGVAQALVHLNLDRALRAAEAELCEGTWQLSTPTLHRVKPQRVTAPPELGAQPAWYYRISRAEMTLTGCPGVDPLAFQHSVSRHLPDWILMRPAHRLSLWQQGRLLILDTDEGTPTTYALALQP